MNSGWSSDVDPDEAAKRGRSWQRARRYGRVVAADPRDNELAQAVAVQVFPMTAPILAMTPSSSRLVGSGVLLRLDSQAFLLTARHVVEQIDGEREFVGVTRGTVAGPPIVLDCQRAVRTEHSPRIDMRQEDSRDLAAVQLTDVNTYELAQHYRFADVGRFGPPPAPGDLVSVYGFPQDNTTRAVIGGVPALSHESLHVITERLDETPSKAARTYGSAAGLIALRFTSEPIWASAAATAPPEPYGLSGCGVWSTRSLAVALDGGIEPVHPRLLGIAHTRPPRDGYMLATPLCHALGMIGAAFPEAKTAADAALAPPVRPWTAPSGPWPRTLSV